MTGLVSYREAGEKNGVRTLCGARFCAVFVSHGAGMAARLSARRAAKYLKARGARQAVFPKDYPNADVFARFGILPPSERALRQVKAAEIVRCAMEKLGLAKEKARIALIAASPSAALESAAFALSREVRYLSLCAPGDERIARALRWDCGAGVSVGTTEGADLAAVFSGGAVRCRCPVLALEDMALAVRYEADGLPAAAEKWEKNALLCALHAAGALDAASIFVKDVAFPAETGENGNLP